MPFYPNRDGDLYRAIFCGNIPVISRLFSKHDTQIQPNWSPVFWKMMKWLDDYQHESLAPRIASNGKGSSPFITYQVESTDVGRAFNRSKPATEEHILPIFKILIDSCRALDYLHRVGRAHGRLHPAVITFSHHRTLIVDYDGVLTTPLALARHIHTHHDLLNYKYTPATVDTYMAPELLHGLTKELLEGDSPNGTEADASSSNGATPKYLQPIQPSADVFSFGLILWSIFCNSELPVRLHMKNIREGETAQWKTRHECISAPLEALYLACTQLDPAKRPTMDEIEQSLLSARADFIDLMQKNPEAIKPAKVNLPIYPLRTEDCTS